MLSLVINLLITLLGLGLVIALAMYYWPKIQEILEDQLLSSLSRETEDKFNRPIYSVFYQYKHDSSEAWSAWLCDQDQETQDTAFMKLIEHLNENPKEWGGITVEVIKALVAFGNSDSFDALVKFIERAREVWGTHKSVKFCYEAACKGIIALNAANAKSVILNEIEARTNRKQMVEIKSSVLDSLKDYPEAMGIEDILIRVLVNRAHLAEVREYTIAVAKKREEHEYLHVFKKALEQYSKADSISLTADDGEIVKQIAHELCKEISHDDEAWQVVLDAAESTRLSSYLIEVLISVASDLNLNLSNEQLYSIMNISKDRDGKLRAALAKRFSLSDEEFSIVSELSVLEKYPFTKEEIVTEKYDEELLIQTGLDDSYNLINAALTKMKLVDENGDKRTGGGVLLSGGSEIEKLYLSRVIASKRKWSFIYTDIKELIRDGKNVNQLTKNIRTSKPCLLYLEGISTLLNAPENDMGAKELHKCLGQFVNDPMFFVVATSTDQITFEEGVPNSALLAKLPRDLFPLIRNFQECTEKQKISLLEMFLEKLVPGRGQEQFVLDQIIAVTPNLSLLEYTSYLLKYLHASLLVFGKLVPIEEYNDLTN